MKISKLLFKTNQQSKKKKATYIKQNTMINYGKLKSYKHDKQTTKYHIQQGYFSQG